MRARNGPRDGQAKAMPVDRRREMSGQPFEWLEHTRKVCSGNARPFVIDNDDRNTRTP